MMHVYFSFFYAMLVLLVPRLHAGTATSSRTGACSPGMAVESVDTLTQADFLKKYFHKQPVLIRAAGGGGGRVGGLRLSSRLLLDLGAEETPVQTGIAGDIIGNNGEGTRVQPFKEYVAQYLALKAPSQKEQCQQEQQEQEEQEDNGEKAYLFDRGGFYGSAPSLVRDVLLEPFKRLPFHLPPLPTMVECEGGFSMQAADRPVEAAATASTSSAPSSSPRAIAVGPEAGQDVYLLAGGNGTGVAWHYHADSVVALFAGQKRWFLAPPDASPLPRNRNPAGLAAWVEGGTTGVAGLLECYQNPGDVMYVPERWHHGVINYGDGETFAVALQARVSDDPLMRARHLANQLRVANRFTESEEVHRAMSKRWPDHPAVLASFATLLAQVAARAEDEHPGSGQPGFFLVVELATKALGVDPHDDETALLLCKAAQNVGDHAKAASACELAELLHPWSHDAAFSYGNALAAAGAHLQAVGAFQRAAKVLLPSRSSRSSSDGATMAGSNHDQASVADYASRGAWLTQYHLANNLMQVDGGGPDEIQARVSSAIEAYRKVVAWSPGRGQVHFELAMALHRSGAHSSEEAVEQLMKAVELVPELQPHAEKMLANIQHDYVQQQQQEL